MMHAESEQVIKDEDISEDEIFQAMEASINTHKLLYADVALNITNEFCFFDKDNYPLTIPNKPAMPASQNDLQHSLDWQKTLTMSDESIIDPTPLSPDQNPTISITTDANNNGSVSWASHPTTSTQFSITAPSYLNQEQSLAFNIIAHHLTDHLQGRDPPQLLMAIHGQGKTGKMCLLQAITSLFQKKVALISLQKQC
jgi:hypothetical protein